MFTARYGLGSLNKSFCTFGLGLIPSHSRWNLWPTNWYWTGFFSQCFLLSPSVSFFQISILIFIHIFLFTRRKMEDVWEGSIKQCSFGNLGGLNLKALLLCFGSKYLMTRCWICRSLAATVLILFWQKVLHLEQNAMAAVSLFLPATGQAAPCHVSAG